MFHKIYENFETIEKLTKKTGEYVDSYIILHRRIMRSTGFWRFLRNALGFRTNFQQLRDATGKNRIIIDNIKKSAMDFQKEKENELTPIQKKFISCLVSYINALNLTTDQLAKVAEVLYNLNINMENIRHYDFDKIQSDYLDSIRNYKAQQKLMLELYSELHADILSRKPLSCDD